MTNRTNFKVGIIAEDNSDVDSIKILIKRITNKNNFTFKKFAGKGCGNIIKKSNTWSRILKQQGCSYLILIHDRDTNDNEILHKKINNSLEPCPIKNYIISIPIEELEAWLLSDSEAIKKVFSLNKFPKIDNKPYMIQSPKEYLDKLIYSTTKGEKIYLNTEHNQKISEVISIEKIKEKNPSFVPLYDFIIKFFCN